MDKEAQRQLVEQIHRKALKTFPECGDRSPNDAERPMLSYKEFGSLDPGSELYEEWELYLRQIEQLLQEGHEGKFILIKGNEIVGIYHTEEEAREVSLERFLLQPHLLHQIRSHEPILRTR